MSVIKPKNKLKTSSGPNNHHYKFLLQIKNNLLPKHRWLKITLISILCLIAIFLGIAYGIARWYIASEANQPYTMGVSFIPDYASYLGLNPKNTMQALINDLHVKNFRLTSYWTDIEPTPGHYDFSQLDWEFAMADAAHAKISLSIGLRQPRWPECHTPTWINTSAPESSWQPALEQYMTAVIDRYKDNPALGSYQLENEYFNNVFGTCNNYDRSRLVSEYNLVKQLDSKHPVIINRSNNAIGTPVGQPTPDIYGVSVYKRVWAAPIGRYFEYPIPAWWYAFLAGVQKITQHKDMIIDEMQAEPWTPSQQTILNSTLYEQNKSLDNTRLKQRFSYAKATGIKTVYFWGAEYWYYRLTIEHDPSLWNTAKTAFLSNSNRLGN